MVSSTLAPQHHHHHHPSSPLSSSPTAAPQKKTMSITQTYFLAHKARGKLSREAAQPDHNLRLLVGHANLLDSLMLDLAEAEREQESWFNQSVRGAASTPTKPERRHVQWADSVADNEWDGDSDSSDSDMDYDDADDDVEMTNASPAARVPAIDIPSSPRLDTIDLEEEADDDEEDYEALTLTRSPSHSPTSPPGLDDDEESSEDESMPPSPPTATMPTFSEQPRDHKYKDSRQEEQDKSDFYDQGFYLPARNPARLVSAISVY